jgi:predicted ester cyclase
MARPLWEVADVIRMAGSKLWERLGETLNWGQLKLLCAIVNCRTAALGGHRDRCNRPQSSLRIDAFFLRLSSGAPADHLKYLSEFRRAFPDLVGTVDQFTFADGIGAAVTTWSGTHSGELAGIAATGNKPILPTGRKLSWLVNYVFRIEGGKIIELWEAWDEANTYLKLTTSPQGK